ncbi:MAG: hypothetical protein COA97_05490 [Flavobacteriales bacterium]|nr:MAG: hypothetical protein COA97_05490 [Flavobacteriales bacterium]
MKQLTLILLLIISGYLNAQTTAIPDANFEQELINQGYDSGPIDGSIPTSNIDTITRLIVYNLGISDLAGIEDFTALEFLDCYFNFLTTLDMSQNTALTHLRAGYNQLTSVNVTQNPNLKMLDCFINQLSSIDVTQNPSLDTLFLSDNQLTSLDVTQNSNLEYLACAKNQLSSLDVTNCVQLTRLDCYYNQLTAVDVTQCPQLVRYYPFNNMITAVNISQNPLLEIINCSNNQLSLLDVSSNPVLRIVVCDQNSISELNLSQNPLLTNLSCDTNQLTCLNIKSGSNDTINYINAEFNPNLTCIEVDNVAFSTSNWIGSYYIFDPAASFSTSCPIQCLVGIDELSSSSISIHPNPTNGQITISLEENTGILTIRNYLGQLVLSENFNGKEFQLNFDVPQGIYFLQLETNGKVITKKIIKQ